MCVCYLSSHKAISKPIQAGLATGEVSQVSILQPIRVKLPQDERQVVVATGESRKKLGQTEWAEWFRL